MIKHSNETATQQHNKIQQLNNTKLLYVLSTVRCKAYYKYNQPGMATKVADTIKAFLDTYFNEYAGDISPDGPRLEYFVPPQDALLGSLWNPQRTNVPARQSIVQHDGFITAKRPNFLLYGLHDTDAQLSQPAVHDHINAVKLQGPSFLYGTSGAGKTRSVFEYLSRNKGFYLLAHDFTRNAGSRDLMKALACDMPIADLDDTRTDMTNRTRIEKRLSMLLFVRFAVHEKLSKLLGREITPYEWLLYQIFPEKLLGGDVYFQTMMACDVNDVEGFVYFQHWAPKINDVWSIFVDEAQALLDMNKMRFLSKNGKQARSAFSALVEGFGTMANGLEYLHYPVFSGTGLAFDQFAEATMSIVGKSAGESVALFFAGFRSLGVEDVQEYLRQFLHLSDASNEVLTHVANWLRGRPRWTASFMEVYLCRQERKNYQTRAWRTQGKFRDTDAKLIEALDRYLNVMTSGEEKETSRRESWSAGQASAYACFERVHRKVNNSFDMNERKLLKKVEMDLEYAVYKFAIGAKPHPFTTEASKLLIENGVGAVHEINRVGTMVQGHINEPIVVQSGINFFDMDFHLRETLVLQQKGGLGDAFERLLLPGLLMEKRKLHDFVKSHVKDSDVSRLENYDVSVRSAYGVLCVDTSDNIEETIDWVKRSLEAKFEGQVAPFCYPDVIIGPDVIFLLRNRNNYEDFLACFVQSKYVIEVTNQQDALRTLVPDLLFHQSRGKPGKVKLSEQLCADLANKWDNLKDKLVCDHRPCLRLLVQMPAEPTAAAVFGGVPPDATGPKSKSTRRKRDWLVVVDDVKAEELFSSESANVIRLLKKAKGAF